jgi:MFS family permease
VQLDAQKRWLALIVLCFGDLMIVLDSTIVNVALPSIRSDLGFSEASLAWVVNAYLLTFGGFLLLGGWLGDLFGHRRLFLIGLSVFTLASLACGLATSKGFLVGARAVQGLGGAVVSVVVLSLIMILFTEPAERAKAMGIVGFVLSGGGTAGVLLGGDSHRRAQLALDLPCQHSDRGRCLRGLPHPPPSRSRPRAGDAARHRRRRQRDRVAHARGLRDRERERGRLVLGPDDRPTLGSGVSPGRLPRHRDAGLGAAHAARPVPPPQRVPANTVGVLMAGAMFGWFFLSALYLQLVLGYSPLQVGLAFLPGTLIWGASSISLSDRLVMRFGFKVPLIAGLLLFVIGLSLFARAPVDGNYAVDVLPGMILIGFGGGITFNPLLLAAMGDVAPTEAGLASGIVNTAFMMGGALGLAVLASIAASWTDSLAGSGDGPIAALTGGYHIAFLVGAAFAAAAGLLGAGLLRPGAAALEHAPGEPAPATSSD